MPGATLQRATVATLTALPDADPAAPVLLGVGATFGGVLGDEQGDASSVTPMRACAH